MVTKADADDLLDVEPVVPMDPLLALLHLRHTYTSPFTTPEEKQAAQSAIMKEIDEHNMRPMYQLLCESFGWPYDQKRANEMDQLNAEKLAKLDARIKDAEDHLGDVELREGLLAKCDFFARIGDLTQCLQFNKDCSMKTLAAGPKLDLCFQRIRLGIAFSDNEIAATGILDAHRLLKDGDWERRNRLKVYEGLYYAFIRDFSKASGLLLESLTTFASTELLDFHQFILLTVMTSLPVLGRADLKRTVIDSPEVVSANLTDLEALVNSIYLCQYSKVFPCLDVVCQQMRRFVFLSSHINYLFREVRVLAFQQFLDSYSSVTLASMASAFRLPVAVLDQMLSTLTSNERLSCKMDRVTGSIKTYRGSSTNFDYHKAIKNGDLLLNRLQKLSRLVEM